MRSILVLNPKGGCGKSTLATNIAGWYASERGAKVALADCDPQGSSKDWLAARPENRPPIHSATVTANKASTPRGTDILIIDSPAASHGSRLASLMKHAQTVLIPIMPSAMDTRAAERFLDELIELRKVSQKKVKLATVANRVREDTIAGAELDDYLDHLKLPNGSKLKYLTLLRASQNYVHAAEQGLSIFELAPSRTYYDREQWEPLLKWLNSAHSQP